MSGVAIRVDDLHKSYGGTPALAGVSFEVREGEMFGLIGPDGAGKTTLMRILATLIDAGAGAAEVLGRSVSREPGKIREAVGYMPQQFSLYQDLSVAENMRFFADLFGVSAEGRKKRTAELLDFSRLGPFVKRRAGALSGGMKQKLALSCALIHTPRLLLLDEPTTGVDPVSRRDFWEMLGRLREEGVTILVSTPYMNEAALCGRMVFIHKGRILAGGTADEITQLFAGEVYSLSGPHLPGIAARLKLAMAPELVRIVGDRVQAMVLEGEGTGAKAAFEELRRSGRIERAPERVDPDIEDAFVALMRK
jgi:ABC-2 type transport system ATP-binding protein